MNKIQTPLGRDNLINTVPGIPEDLYLRIKQCNKIHKKIRCKKMFLYLFLFLLFCLCTGLYFYLQVSITQSSIFIPQSTISNQRP